MHFSTKIRDTVWVLRRMPSRPTVLRCRTCRRLCPRQWLLARKTARAFQALGWATATTSGISSDHPGQPCLLSTRGASHLHDRILGDGQRFLSCQTRPKMNVHELRNEVTWCWVPTNRFNVYSPAKKASQTARRLLQPRVMLRWTSKFESFHFHRNHWESRLA